MNKMRVSITEKNGALRGIDFYAIGDNKDFVWNPKRNMWDQKENL